MSWIETFLKGFDFEGAVQKKNLNTECVQVLLVAGAGFEPTTFGL